MDGTNEKKWFVYMGDHHEGPFSLPEIEAKMGQSLVTSESYVWCEGMPDWKVMKDLSDFAALVAPPPKKPQVPEFPKIPAAAKNAGVGDASLSNALTAPLNPLKVEEAPVLGEPALVPAVAGISAISIEPVEPGAETPELATPEFVEPVLASPEPVKAAVAAPEPAVVLADAPPPSGQREAESKTGGRFAKLKEIQWGKWASIMGVTGSIAAVAGAYFSGSLDPLVHSPAVQAACQTAADFAQPYLLQVADKFPALGKWISPIPALDDVSPEDYEELKNASKAKLDKDGAKLAVALSKTDLFSPTFYVASNLPDGAQLDVFIVGIPETLLNQLSFVGQSQAVITKKLGKSSPVRFSDGKLVPRGEYMVYAMESETQPPQVKPVVGSVAGFADSLKLVKDAPGAALPRGRKLVIAKTYFLGGNRDNVYAARLKEFHDKLQARAKGELAEARQFSGTLESRLQMSVAKFAELRKGSRVTPAQKKAWTAFHKQWSDMSAQLDQTFQKWTPESLEKDYFYGILFQLTQQAGAAIERAHGFHDQYFTTKVPSASAFDIQVGEAVSQAQGAVNALKAKIDQAENLPPTQNGMPRKEGL